MTDTTELLKYAEGREEEGEVIKVLYDGLMRIVDNVPLDLDAAKEIANDTLTRATAILGGNLKDKTDEAHNG